MFTFTFWLAAAMLVLGFGCEAPEPMLLRGESQQALRGEIPPTPAPASRTAAVRAAEDGDEFEMQCIEGCDGSLANCIEDERKMLAETRACFRECMRRDYRAAVARTKRAQQKCDFSGRRKR